VATLYTIWFFYKDWSSSLENDLMDRMQRAIEENDQEGKTAQNTPYRLAYIVFR
jgi:hypothetical protein